MVNLPTSSCTLLRAQSIRRPILFRGLRLLRSRITVARPLHVWGQQMTAALRATSFLTALLATLAVQPLCAQAGGSESVATVPAQPPAMIRAGGL